MTYTHTDGGRAAAGFKGSASDCATRALALAAEIPYREAYNLINEYAAAEKPSRRRRGKSSARTGVHALTLGKLLADRGWRWTATTAIGSGMTVHVRPDELPSSGRLILRLSRHYAAWIDGELHDDHDSSRDGKRGVYGYWHKEDAK
jgi:hypothetical protein